MTESLREQVALADQTLRDAERRIERFREVPERIAAVTGRGEAAEGKIVAEWRSGELVGLEYDPTVMRMASADLAAATREAVAEAVRDFGAQVRVVMAEAGVEPGRAATPEQLREQLATMREQFTKAGTRALDGLDDARRRLGR